ncbi:MAG: ATP-binding cassette domain-containing protein [Oligoflexales bacterium]|nr:ATP-binding cassette domain-containing protein [Oligoflexales bacterium]
MTPLLHTHDFIPYNPGKASAFIGSWDIEVNQSDRICIYGDSGSGKSLFLKSLTLLYPPHSGRVYFGKQLITQEHILWFRSKVIYLQQVPQFGEDTIAEEMNRVFRFKIYKSHYKHLQAQALQLVKEVGLEADILASKAYELSGGQKQKIHLVLGLCLNPHILILDEPTASLDEKSTIHVEQLLRGWVEEVGHERAYLWVSHQSSQRKRVGSRFFHVADGSLSIVRPEEVSYSSASM